MTRNSFDLFLMVMAQFLWGGGNLFETKPGRSVPNWIYALLMVLCLTLIGIIINDAWNKDAQYQAEGERLRRMCVAGNAQSCQIYMKEY